MQMAILKTISVWCLILILSILLIPLIDMFVTTIHITILKHKMRKELKKAVDLSRSNLQKELYKMIDEAVDCSFNIPIEEDIEDKQN